MIELKSVSKFYNTNGQVTIGLNDISLKMNQGEFVVVYGESGSGKSTFLNVIGGIDTYENGEVYINGIKMSSYTEQEIEEYRRKNVGFIFQNYQLIDSYTVYENVMLTLLMQGIPAKEAKQRAEIMIEKVQLTKRINHKAAKLSGGEKQRCVIARALAGDAPLIACDEPTGNLDVKTGEAILNLLKELSKDRLVIMVTHNLKTAMPYATRKIRIFDGKIAEDVIISDEKSKSEFEPRNFPPLPTWKGSYIALKNILATPKRSLFMLFAFCFLTFALIFTMQIIHVQDLIGPSVKTLDRPSLELNMTPSRSYYLTVGATNKAFVDEQFEKNAAFVSYNNYFLYDNISLAKDPTLTINLSSFYFNLGYSDVKLTLGRLPLTANEIILGVKPEFQTAALERNIGKYLEIPQSSRRFTIVGFFKSNVTDNRGEVRFDFEHFPEIEKEFLISKRDYMKQCFHITADIDTLYPKIVEGSKKQIYVDTRYDISKLKMYSKTALVDLDDPNLEVININMESIAFGMTYDAFKYLSSKYPTLVTLYYNSLDSKINDYNRLIENSELFVVDPLNIRDTVSNYDDILSSLIGYGLYFASLVVTIVFIGVISFALGFVMKAKIRDYDIFRTFGLSKKQIRFINFCELFFIDLFACLITLLILLFTPLNDLLYEKAIASTLGIMISLLAVVYLCYRFDKRIFRFTINTSLKAGDFLD